MALTRTAQLVEQVHHRMDSFVVVHGFTLVDRHQWLRRWGWKTDTIRLITEQSSGLVINFEVHIPPIPGSLCHCDIGIINLSNLMGDPRGTLRYPKTPSDNAAFVDKIAAALPLGLTWLARYDTPKLCLEQLLTEHTNPDSIAFKHSQSFLQSLPQELNEESCLLDLKYDYPNAYMKAIFDIRHRGFLPDPP